MTRDPEATLAEVRLATAVVDALSNDLRRQPWKHDPNPVRGHCYVAAEACFYLLGGLEGGWHPEFLVVGDEGHWYLRHEGGRVLDVTAGQFKKKPDYVMGTPRGFLTGYEKPSKRAAELIRRVQFALGSQC